MLAFTLQQIKKAREEAEILRQDAEEEARNARSLEDEFGDGSDGPQRKYTLQEPDRVLVRLKVEHSGFATLNNQRFGSQFVGQVANPSDILLFHKRRQAEAAKGGKSAASRKKRGAAGLDLPVEPEDLENLNIEDLVTENLVNNEKKLELLDEKSMGEGACVFSLILLSCPVCTLPSSIIQTCIKFTTFVCILPMRSFGAIR